MNKQQVRQVHKLFEEHMRGIGAASREWELGTEYTVSTPSGPATAHLIDSVRRGGIPWLACRFEDPGKARANGLDCNPYSGTGHSRGAGRHLRGPRGPDDSGREVYYCTDTLIPPLPPSLPVGLSGRKAGRQDGPGRPLFGP